MASKCVEFIKNRYCLNYNFWMSVINFVFRLIANSRIRALKIICILTSTIMWTMMSFLTTQWKFNYTYAAGVRNVWSGLTLALPLIFIHVADTVTGDFYMSSFGSVLYATGIGFLSASTPPTSCMELDDLSKCAGNTTIYLYTGLAFTIVGYACIETSLSNFELKDGEETAGGDDLVDWFLSIGGSDDHHIPITCTRSSSSMIMVSFLSFLILIYVNVIKSWHARMLIATIFVGCQALNCMIGKNRYHAHTGLPKSPASSLIATILRVLVASTRKLCVPHPGIHNLYKCNSRSKSTSGLKWLDKAAAITSESSPDQEVQQKCKKSWRLCSVEEVELTKMVLHMFPLWATCILLGVVSSIGDTYFLEQANHLDNKIGKFKLPLLALLGCQKLAGLVITSTFEKLTKRFEKKSKLIPAKLGLAMSMVFSVLCCIVASLIEKKRLGVVKKHGLMTIDDTKDFEIPMSVFWLLPQFILLGGLDTMFEKGNSALSNRFPEDAVRYMALSTTGINGIGRIGGVLSVFLVGRITHTQNKPSWFQTTLNTSRLDRYYWLLAALSGIALVAYLAVATWHFYREDGRSGGDDDSDLEEEVQPSSMNEACRYWCCSN